MLEMLRDSKVGQDQSGVLLLGDVQDVLRLGRWKRDPVS
jgi:hypothetical protein